MQQDEVADKIRLSLFSANSILGRHLLYIGLEFKPNDLNSKVFYLALSSMAKSMILNISPLACFTFVNLSTNF